MFRGRSAPFALPGALRLFFGSLLLALLAACTVSEPPADLRIINGKEPETLDPALVVGQPDGRVALSLFEGLTRYNAVTAAPEPGLAERWDISEDGRTYTFYIRTNALWSNGDPITAHDFVWNWFRVLDPLTASDYVGNLFYIKGAEDYHFGRVKNRAEVGIQALDDRTLRVELVNPTAFFLELCAFTTQAIAHRGTIEKFGDRWLNIEDVPVSGSYQLVSWRLNDKIRVKKNRYYWDSAATRSEVVDFLPANSPSTALNLFLSGEVDIIWDKDVVPTELLDLLRQRPDFHTYEYLGSYFFRFNVTRKPFDDVRVRKALALTVDKERIVNQITKGGEPPGTHFVPRMANYTSPQALEYNPDLGRKLLAEAGYPGGAGFPRFQYLFNTSRDHAKIAVELQAMWKRELGIDVELRSVEWKVYLNAQSSLDYDISRSSWIGDYTDPNTFLDMFMSNNGNNRTGWKNERYDTLIKEANGTPNVEKRAAILAEAEEILIREEFPIVPLYLYVGMNFWDPKKIAGIYNNVRDEHPVRTIERID